MGRMTSQMDEYWEAQVEGFKLLEKKKKIWRDYRNETKEIIDALYEWYWDSGE